MARVVTFFMKPPLGPLAEGQAAAIDLAALHAGEFVTESALPMVLHGDGVIDLLCLKSLRFRNPSSASHGDFLLFSDMDWSISGRQA